MVDAVCIHNIEQKLILSYLFIIRLDLEHMKTYQFISILLQRWWENDIYKKGRIINSYDDDNNKF